MRHDSFQHLKCQPLTQLFSVHLMGDYRVGFLLGTSPRVQYAAQMIGTFSRCDRCTHHVSRIRHPIRLYSFDGQLS